MCCLHQSEVLDIQVKAEGIRQRDNEFDRLTLHQDSLYHTMFIQTCLSQAMLGKTYAARYFSFSSRVVEEWAGPRSRDVV